MIVVACDLESDLSTRFHTSLRGHAGNFARLGVKWLGQPAGLSCWKHLFQSIIVAYGVGATGRLAVALDYVDPHELAAAINADEPVAGVERSIFEDVNAHDSRSGSEVRDHCCDPFAALFGPCEYPHELVDRAIAGDAPRNAELWMKSHPAFLAVPLRAVTEVPRARWAALEAYPESSFAFTALCALHSALVTQGVSFAYRHAWRGGMPTFPPIARRAGTAVDLYLRLSVREDLNGIYSPLCTTARGAER